jgi:hypothetical protein
VILDSTVLLYFNNSIRVEPLCSMTGLFEESILVQLGH